MDNDAIRKYTDDRLAELTQWLMRFRDEDAEHRKILRDEIARRMDELNNLHAMVRDQRATFVPREAYDLQVATILGRLTELGNWKSNMEGRMLVIAALPIVVSVIGAGIAIWAALSQGG